MEILMNELSLEGQFANIDDFLVSLKDIILVQKVMDAAQIQLSKHYNLTNERVTESHTLHQVLTDNSVKTTNEIRRFKMYLKKLLSDPVFWHENQIHRVIDIYNFKHTEKKHDYSLAEACERDKKVISFHNEKYKQDILEIKKNNEKITLLNFHNPNFLSEILYEENLISDNDFCKYRFYDTNLSFSNLDDNYSFNILTFDETRLFISTFKMFSEMSWTDISNHDGLEYKPYTPSGRDWFKNTPFADKKIYKFRTSQKCRCFGYREGDVFFVLRFETDHKISDHG